MNKHQVLNRIKLAAREYIDNDAFSSGVFALLSGKTVDEHKIFLSIAPASNTKLDAFTSLMRETLSAVSDEELKNNMKDLIINDGEWTPSNVSIDNWLSKE